MIHETLEHAQERRKTIVAKLVYLEPMSLEARSKYSKVWLERKQLQLADVLATYGTLHGDDIAIRLAALQAVEQAIRDDIALLENAKKYKEGLEVELEECDNTIALKERERSLER